MKLIIGLGNKGEKFEGTRHNIGLDILKEFKTESDFPAWKKDKYLQAKITSAQINSEKVILGLPQTMMNKSGEAVREFFDRFDLNKKDLWVVHDDKDLNLGQIRIGKNSGSAGHKGVQSIINHIDSKDFFRFRIGIMTNFQKRIPKTKKEVSQFVLSGFFKDEKGKVGKVKKRGLKALNFALKQSPKSAMQEYNN